MFICEICVQKICQSIRLVDDIVLLKTSDGRRFVLAEVDDFDQEITLAGQNQALMEFLAQRSREVSTYSLGQVRERLNPS